MMIIWSPLAIEKVSEIAEYIALDKRAAAENWVNTVFEKVEQQQKSPEIGRIGPEINKNNLREILYNNYRIIYRIEKNQISVLTVRHGKQILPVDDILT